jgi:hypothetical protein
MSQNILLTTRDAAHGRGRWSRASITLQQPPTPGNAELRFARPSGDSMHTLGGGGGDDGGGTSFFADLAGDAESEKAPEKIRPLGDEKDDARGAYVV